MAVRCASPRRASRPAGQRPPPPQELSVADVYDLASAIGKDLEALIDAHGPEHVASLMQKVIEILEHLERLAADRDRESVELDDLRSTIIHFQLEEVKKTEENRRHAQELEQIEDHYKQETKDLLATIKKVQDENRKLSTALTEATEQNDSAFSEDESYIEVDLVNRLQNMIDKQREQIKRLDQTVLNLKTENEELRCAKERLSSVGVEVRRKFRSAQSQIHLLVDERADLTARAQDLEREIHGLSRQLGMATRECNDLCMAAKADVDENRPRFSLPELRNILQERNALKAKVSDLEDELTLFRPKTQPALSPAVPPGGGGGGGGVFSTAASTVAACSQVQTRPNCDCTYHAETAAAAAEQSKASLGEEAFESDDVFYSDCVPGAGAFVAVVGSGGAAQGDDDDEADVDDDGEQPVQGPLPEEPLDAPFRRAAANDSGIRKFFRRVFGGGGGGGGGGSGSGSGLFLPTSGAAGDGGARPDATAAADGDGDRDREERGDGWRSPGGLRQSLSRFSFLITHSDED